MSMPCKPLVVAFAAVLPLLVAAGCSRDPDTNADAAATQSPATQAPAASTEAPQAIPPAPSAEGAPISVTPPPEMTQPTMTGSCDNQAVQAFVGRQGDAATTESARTASGADTVRVLKPGDAATMDYRADRLNIVLKDDGSIESLTCG